MIGNKGYKISWNFTIQYDIKIETQRPHIVVIYKTKIEVKIVDVSISGDVQMKERKVGKIEKYKVLQDETARMWAMKEVIV